MDYTKVWPLLLQNSPSKRLSRGEFKVFCKPQYFSRRVKSAKSTYFRKMPSNNTIFIGMPKNVSIDLKCAVLCLWVFVYGIPS